MISGTGEGVALNLLLVQAGNCSRDPPPAKWARRVCLDRMQGTAHVLGSSCVLPDSQACAQPPPVPGTITPDLPSWSARPRPSCTALDAQSPLALGTCSVGPPQPNSVSKHTTLYKHAESTGARTGGPDERSRPTPVCHTGEGANDGAMRCAWSRDEDKEAIIRLQRPPRAIRFIFHGLRGHRIVPLPPPREDV